MKRETKELVAKLKEAMADLPNMSIMILDPTNQVVWHNSSFQQEFNDGRTLVGLKCWEALKDSGAHEGCPLVRAQNGEGCRAVFDMGDKQIFMVTVPLGDGYAAKIHTYVPKGVNGIIDGNR